MERYTVRKSNIQNSEWDFVCLSCGGGDGGYVNPQKEPTTKTNAHSMGKEEFVYVIFRHPSSDSVCWSVVCLFICSVLCPFFSLSSTLQVGWQTKHIKIIQTGIYKLWFSTIPLWSEFFCLNTFLLCIYSISFSVYCSILGLVFFCIRFSFVWIGSSSYNCWEL